MSVSLRTLTLAGFLALTSLVTLGSRPVQAQFGSVNPGALGLANPYLGGYNPLLNYGAFSPGLGLGYGMGPGLYGSGFNGVGSYGPGFLGRGYHNRGNYGRGSYHHHHHGHRGRHW